jgi:hypothetical protein
VAARARMMVVKVCILRAVFYLRFIEEEVDLMFVFGCAEMLKWIRNMSRREEWCSYTRAGAA